MTFAGKTVAVAQQSRPRAIHQQAVF